MTSFLFSLHSKLSIYHREISDRTCSLLWEEHQIFSVPKTGVKLIVMRFFFLAVATGKDKLAGAECSIMDKISSAEIEADASMNSFGPENHSFEL
ncbi:hypothetical protein QQP08_015382 [Theobroma cacao]|nr:hypothetical protein QQP08_015382 [Theobroma cacao]